MPSFSACSLVVLRDLCTSLSLHGYVTMSRENTVRWSQAEERNLLPWLSRHRKLSWKARSRAYFRQYRIFRSGESLRGKQNDLRRKLQRALLKRDATIRATYRGQQATSGQPPSFSVLAQHTLKYSQRLLLEYSRLVSNPTSTTVLWRQRPFSGEMLPRHINHVEKVCSYHSRFQ